MFSTNKGITYNFNLWYIWALWRPGLSARVPECHNLKTVGQTCMAMCNILIIMHILILCIVYLCRPILCILRSSLWLLYCNKRVCITIRGVGFSRVNLALERCYTLEECCSCECEIYHRRQWKYTQSDNDVICFWCLWSMLPNPCCRATR